MRGTKPLRSSLCELLALPIVLAMSSACALLAPTEPRPAVPPPAKAAAPPDATLVEGYRPWGIDEPEIILVDKHSRRLTLYRYGVLLKSYPVVLGRNSGRKLFEGDRRTPSGVYRITGKRTHPKYHRFLALDYPNDDDRALFRAALKQGQVPSTARPSPGGMIGIHGTDKEDLNRVGVNWTFGCVSLANRDVEELYGLVDPGAMVLLYDDQQP